MSEKRISFVTFHQSFGYEEFIEGYKPRIINADTDQENMVYKLTDGVFKEFCDRAVPNRSALKIAIEDDATIWKMSLGSSDRKDIRDDCLKNDYIRLGYDEEVSNITDEYLHTNIRSLSSVNAFINLMNEGDIVLVRSSEREFDAVARVVGPYERRDDLGEYYQVRKVEWLYKGDPISLAGLPNSKKLVQTTLYRLDWVTGLDISRLINSDAEYGNDKYVFIIDEINRGNVSRIFGETITLIEESKRSRHGDKDSNITVKLSYSKDDFSIPENVYVIGTMNTADRSLVALDAALRRRFHFERIMPDPQLAKAHSGITGVDIGKLMGTINDRIYALYDQEHLIGHSYFIGIDDLEQLKTVFSTEIIPLLEEYFHNDYERIINVLSEKNDPDTSRFIAKDESEILSGIGNANPKYVFKRMDEYTVEDFRSIYE